MSRRVLPLIIGSLLLVLGCGGDDPTAPPTVVSIAVEASVNLPGPFIATATLSDGTREDVTSAAAWTSSDTAVFTVSATGQGQAVGRGQSEICATYRGVSGCAVLTVVPAPRISVTPDSVAFFGGVAGTPPAPQTLRVTNSGGGTLGGLVTDVQFAQGQPTGWLTAALAGVHAPTTLTLTPQTATLPLGVYEALVTVTSPNDPGSPVVVPVTLTLTSNH